MKQLFYLSFAKLPKMILRLVLRYDEKVTANLTKNYCEKVVRSFVEENATLAKRVSTIKSGPGVSILFIDEF